MKPADTAHLDLDDEAIVVVGQALDDLGARAGLWGLASEPGLQLFLLGCLKAEVDYRILATVWDCRDLGFTWAEIGELLSLPAETARARYDDSDPAEPPSP